MSYSEKIRFDELNDEVYIERSTGYGKDEIFEKLPLSQWGLIKKLEVFAHVTKKVPLNDYEKSIKVLHYQIPITFEIIENVELGKYVYLKLERKAFDIEIRDNNRSEWVTVMLRDVNFGTTQPCPLPNQYFKNAEFPYLKITVWKATDLLTKKELLNLYRSKKCIGYFDEKIEKYIVSE